MVNVPLLPCPDEIAREHLRAENDDITQADGDRNGREETDCGESVLAEHPADKQVVDDTAGAESDQHQNVAERYPQERSAYQLFCDLLSIKPSVAIPYQLLNPGCVRCRISPYRTRVR